MSSRDDGGPAFSISREAEGWYERGMSLRDYFAGQALPAVVTALFKLKEHNLVPIDNDKEMFEVSAEKAYAMADAMLEARK